jgi:hypothetical protein
VKDKLDEVGDNNATEVVAVAVPCDDDDIDDADDGDVLANKS